MADSTSQRHEGAPIRASSLPARQRLSEPAVPPSSRSSPPRDIESAPSLERDLFEPPPRPRAAWLRLLLTGTGIICVLGGIILGPVPVVPGFPLIIAGALMLAASNATARRGMNRLEHVLPSAMRTRLRGLLGRSPPRDADAGQAERSREGRSSD